MNLPHVAELSLYQLVSTIVPNLPSLKVSAVTLEAGIGAILDFLSEERINTNIWLKLAVNQSLIEEITNYHQQGNSELIYLCQHLREEQQIFTIERSQLNPSLTQKRRIFLRLEANYHLEQEFLFLVLSSQWCCLLVAKKDNSINKLDLVLTENLQVIKATLTAIQEVIAITDQTPEDVLTEIPLLNLASNTLKNQQFTKLFYKQIQRTETLICQQNNLINTEHDSQFSLLINILNQEFLNSLVARLNSSITHQKTALSILTSQHYSQEQKQRYLNILHQECERQNALNIGLQQLSQLEVNPSHNSLTYLEEIVPNIASIYQPLAQEKGIELHYTIPVGFPPVKCSANNLRQIIINLLNNSLKFTQSQGKIYVKSVWINQEIELIISDTGIGILSSDLAKVYQSFYQGENILPEHKLSAGLGLTIVKQILMFCGGSIRIKSKVNRGTVVKINLPIALNN